jgi:hypothetical protein
VYAAQLDDLERLARLAALGARADPAGRLAAEHGAAAWQVPGDQHRRALPPPEPGAPPWWHGDEEASQSFLAAVGLKLE